MEIERKFLVESCPDFVFAHPHHKIEQGYLCTEPVVRIRRQDEDYILTYKSKGHMVREEYNLPLTQNAYTHLRQKVDGRLITKTRYKIPYTNTLTIELDLFEGDLSPLLMAEVEFTSEEEALAFIPPDWFGEDVTFSSSYHNSTLSKL